MSDEVPVAGNAADIARAALRHLAQHRLAPTPRNYADAWSTVSAELDPQTRPMVRAAEARPADSRPSDLRPADSRPSDSLAAEAAEAVRLANRRSRLMASMTELIETICDVVPGIADDQGWVAEQFGAIRQVVRPASGPPDRGALEHVRAQLSLSAADRRPLVAARRESLDGLKSTLAQWLGSLSQVAESSRDYGDRLGGFADRIRSVDSLADLTSALAELIADTQAAQGRIEASRTELEVSCRRAEELEGRVSALAQQLSATAAQASTDHLTGLLNRRGLDDAFGEIHRDCQAAGSPLALALLDLDDFKRLNDRFGHAAGDEALRQFAVLLKSQLRPGDQPARYGGEEFVLLLPGATAAAAVEVVHRLQRSQAERALLGGPGHVPTFSAGVCEIGDGGFTRALERADDALYEAKRAGKNRVHSIN